MQAFTDYPLNELGQQGPVPVKVTSYDRNKYATVIHGDIQTEIKTGYLFKDQTLAKRFSPIAWAKLPRSPQQAAPTNQQAYNDLKQKRKRKTFYIVDNESGRKKFRSLHDALSRFGQLTGDAFVWEHKTNGKRSQHECIVHRESALVYITTAHAQRHRIKLRHVKAHGL